VNRKIRDMARDIAIVPQPKRIATGSGPAFAAAGAVRLECEAFEEEARRGLAGLGLMISPRAGRRVTLRLVSRHPSDQAYRLVVHRDSIRIECRAAVGAFYAFQTLRSLCRDGAVPEVEVDDFPDHPLRGVHWDMKRFAPSFEYLRDTLARLGRLKVNAVLVEYEDKFPYRRYPEFRHPDALTLAELSALHRAAADNHIELVPLVQTFGHMENFLRHRRTRHLQEVRGNAWSLCPLNGKALPFVRGLLEEIVEAHPDGTYVHIGCDEVYELGSCKRCRRFVRRHGASRLFVHHVNRVAEAVASLGRVPVVWHDMLVNHPEAIGELDRRIVVAYWEYRDNAPVLDEDAIVACGPKWNGHYLRRSELRGVPHRIRQMFRRYWWTRDGRPRGFAYLEFFRDHGLRTWGCSCTRCQEAGVVDFRESFDNIAHFSHRALGASAAGMVNTSWAASGIPFDLAWYGFYWAANCFWNVRADRRTFDVAFARDFFGLEDTEVVQAFWLLSGQDCPGDVHAIARARTLVGRWRGSVRRNRAHLDLLMLQIEKLMLRVRIGWLLYDTIEYQALSRALPLRRKVEKVRGLITGLLSENDRLREMGEEVYAKFAPGRTIEEELAWEFDYLARFLGTLSRGLPAILAAPGERPGRRSTPARGDPMRR